MPDYIILILIVLGALLVFVVGKSGSSRSHHDSAFDDLEQGNYLRLPLPP